MVTPSRGDFFVINLSGFFAAVIRWVCSEKLPEKRCTLKLGNLKLSFGNTWKKASVCHAGVALNANTLVEAAMDVRISPISKYNPDALIWSTDIVPTSEKVADEALKFLNHEYSYLGLIAIGLAQQRFGISLHYLTKRWWVNRINNDAHTFCSQLVERARHNAGFLNDFSDDELPIFVSPQNLYSLIQRYQDAAH